MRQVPHYLIIGNGRVSRHFQHYFKLLNLSFSLWHRPMPEAALTEKARQATHILILISDRFIELFAENNLGDIRAKCIHFSGSLVCERVIGAHPLIGFNTDLYSQETYQSIPFILDHDAPEFANVLPGLSNPHVRLSKNQKAKYHALCVMAGNFSCILWQKLFSSLENEFHISSEIAKPYLKQQTDNLIRDAKSALTGPLTRGDMETIQKNLAALDGDAFKNIYQSFVTCYETLNNEVII